jgi:uncharacterized phosphosugar-binding protein
MMAHCLQTARSGLGDCRRALVPLCRPTPNRDSLMRIFQLSFGDERLLKSAADTASNLQRTSLLRSYLFRAAHQQKMQLEGCVKAGSVERISLLIMQTLAERSVDRGTVIQTLVDLADILQHEETLTEDLILFWISGSQLHW